MTRILVVGGYGAFGGRLAERLAREADLDIVIAGRSRARAEEAAGALRRAANAVVSAVAFDADAPDAAQLAALSPRVVVNASGPFQSQDYALARACIANRSHYVDLADARTFVTGIVALDAEAKAAGVLAVSGASSVPGLSSAAVESLAPDFRRLKAIQIAISPGNSFDPGLATTESVLGGAGRPIAVRVAGRPATVYGWQGLSRTEFPGLGRRWTGFVDVPDLELMGQRWPELEAICVRAGLEVGAMHWGLWALSWLVRCGIVSRPGRLAGPLLALKRRLSFLGSDSGGMIVTLEGLDAEGQARRSTWSLVARSGHGPYVPTLGAIALAKRLARGKEVRRGAEPCLGLFTLADVAAEMAGLDIGWSVRSETI